ncbi:MAG: GNAT family N-acetyltransferase [Anaerolineales bacterium]|jgi:ribosomal protein S18 acetylase RimI-like enzyme
MDEVNIKPSREDDMFDGMRFRLAVEDDLREMEWEGRYKRYRRVYKDVYHRASRGLALMWVVELPSFGLIGQAFIQLKMRDRSCANGTSRAYIHSFRVRPSLRNRGIGTDLMAHIEQDLKARGFQEVTLNVAEDNHGALRLYERLGYQIMKKIPGTWSYYDDRGKLRHVSEPGFRLMKVLD